MYSKLHVLSLLSVFISLSVFTQNCDFTIEGVVKDEATGEPLSFVNVIVQELSTGVVTDDHGFFALSGICGGEYHLILTHIGCGPKEAHFHLTGDTLLNITLDHTPISLEGVVIEGKLNRLENLPNQSINKQTIEDNSNKNFASLLENETGVHVLKSGSGIAKPVVHGMYGNRLTILNNGVVQSGQQWGNDHSPEIDPLVANQITIIKGTNALEFGGGNMGTTILLEPKKIGTEPHLHGNINYAFETNGRGHNLNLQLQKYSPSLAWRANGTFRKYGDRRTPDYFLNNTGNQELNFSLQLEKAFREKLFLDLYLSTFNADLGVLRGSHISNLTNLEIAFNSDVPYYTEPNFSYAIEAPKQKVAHHFLKLNTKYYIDQVQSLQLVLAFQSNNRDEFDIRRGGRTKIPSLSLRQYTFNADWKYQREFDHHWRLKLGGQNIITDNTNLPDTGILPLIPDYISFKTGWFGTLNKSLEKLDINLGLRYDFEQQNVVTISRGVPREIIRYNNGFSNLSGAMGIKYDLSKAQSLSLNSGYSRRNPAINELYSKGLHQGVSGIEEGDVDLKTEKAFKTTLEYKLFAGVNFSFSSLLYYQRIKDYIFLNPQNKMRLTIRGAFPVFAYEQTDAEIFGWDVSSQFSLGKSFVGHVKYSFIRGNNKGLDVPLIYIPPASLHGNFTYRFARSFKVSKTKIEDVELEWSNRYVFRQNNLLESQDFAEAPQDYLLSGLKLSSNIVTPQFKLRFFIKVDNLLNTRYRDYLNRQRYFADDLGISFTTGLNFKF